MAKRTDKRLERALRLMDGDEPAPCRFCGRLVLAGVCCHRAGEANATTAKLVKACEARCFEAAAAIGNVCSCPALPGVMSHECPVHSVTLPAVATGCTTGVCLHRFVKFIDSGVVCATCGERVEGFSFFCRDCGTEWRTPGQAMRCLHLKPESGGEA